jgi:hypothetical protein
MNALNSNLSSSQSNGETLRISDYRQKQNLVILLTGKTSFGLLSRLVNDLSERYAEFRAEETEILVVVGGFGQPPEELGAGLPFPVATYPESGIDGKTPATISENLNGATIYVLDRYGEVYALYQPIDLSGVPTTDDLLEWLRFIELQCPE